MCGGPIIPDGCSIVVKDGDWALFNKHDLTPEIRSDLEKEGYYLIERGPHVMVVPNNHPDAVEDRLNKVKDLTIDFGGKLGAFVVKEKK